MPRVFIADKLFQLENLGMSKEQYSAYNNMIHSPSGLILITGPTGGGKTATLYASLIRLNDGRRKINTIEDPIEYAIDGLRQSQVNLLVNPPLSFGELLRSVMTFDVEAGIGFGVTEPLRFFQAIGKAQPLLLHPGKDVIAGAVENAVDAREGRSV